MNSSVQNDLPVGFAMAPIASSELEQLRHLCLDLDEVSEQTSPEQTSFKVGQRAFVVVETYRTPEGKPYNCLAFKASFFDLERLRQERGFFPAPYLGGPGWLGRRLDNEADPIDWTDLEASLMRSHRQIVGRATRKSRTGEGTRAA
jgi:predicted DNA-binding protein (MmcQ/YjbR family)